MNPTVSICVPNLNTRPFLPERFETIFQQTLKDWELLVYDSYSDDGAWENIQQLATKLPCLVTMLEGSNTIRRGTMADALKATRAQVVIWTAAEAGIEELTKCGLRGSPTVVKRVFAPGARADKARIIELAPAARDTADALLDAIFAAQGALEADVAAAQASL